MLSSTNIGSPLRLSDELVKGVEVSQLSNICLNRCLPEL